MAKNTDIETGKNESVEKLRTALAELGLLKVDDLLNKRVSNPEALINALANLFASVKEKN